MLHPQPIEGNRRVMQFLPIRALCTGFFALLMVACSDSSNNNGTNSVSTPLNTASVYEVANGCFAISPDGGTSFIDAIELGEEVALSAASLAPLTQFDSFVLTVQEVSEASRFLLRPSDLGKYLLYDERRQYLASYGEHLLRQPSLASDITEVDGEVVINDRMQSEGEWQLMAAKNDRFKLQHILSGNYITADGTLGDETAAADLDFVEQEG